MPTRDVVVVGASAGGVEALTAFVAGLPADLPAAVVVVMHVPPTGHSGLADILNRHGPLPATTAQDGDRLRPGHIYVAGNGRHLLIKHDHLVLSRAPKQNRVRPSVDTLFRSAARWLTSRVVGVVLSGYLDDGTAGLAAIVSLGGAAVVQDPDDAIAGAMPRAALSVVPDAVVRPVAKIGAEIARLVGQPAPQPGHVPDDELVRETDMLETSTSGRIGEPAAVGCPDCNGGMREIRTGGAVHFLCHVGHSWSPLALAAAQAEKVEQSLWTAVSMLEEQAAIHRLLAERATGPEATLTRRHQSDAADEATRAAETIRKQFPDLLPRLLDPVANAGTNRPI
ncbi:chemotaxis protein CheB [Actinoplanes sp. URMC 104]|uniref:chemotaxis protein CheB n=1 Tax=Actinoplanes sp. URMC 104 TaxID=3423409 RepID=UPI003F1C691A